jgi:DNA (cytosine-5)-methyltransferase 1
MTLTVGSLFSGIGGIDLGLERAGMRVIWQSEIDPFACKVLKKHWPEVPNYGDIKKIKWDECERPDVICGGYPCQPFSTAGNRKGKDDPRHLWPWVRTAISELRPQFAIMENVRGHLSLGGLQVIGQLAEIGYDAEWRVISAASVGANHKRERIIIVAYPKSELSNGFKDYARSSSRPEAVPKLRDNSRPQNVAYFNHSELGDTNKRRVNETSARKRRKVFVTDSSGCSDSRAYEHWLLEPDVGRVAHGVSHRVDRLRGLGNAVVPQVAEIVGRLVMEAAEQ